MLDSILALSKGRISSAESNLKVESLKICAIEMIMWEGRKSLPRSRKYG